MTKKKTSKDSQKQLGMDVKTLRLMFGIMAVIVVIIGVGLYYVAMNITFANPNSDSTIKEKEKPIGGDTDIGGCLIGAGYQYDEDIQACIRDWELNENERKAAKIVVEDYGPKKGLTVDSIETYKCVGCFNVQLKDGDGVENIFISNWRGFESTGGLSITECELLMGRPQNIGGECNPEEDMIGDITGFKPDSICCIKKEIKSIEQDKRYITRDENQCTNPDYNLGCGEDEEEFSDETGCGCVKI